MFVGPLVDRALVARLEHSAAAVAAATAAQHHGGLVVPVARGALVILGPGRYLNRAVGATLDGLDDAALAELEDRCAAAGVPAAVEVCSWAPPTLLARLAERGYRPDWFRDVFVHRPGGDGFHADGVTIRQVDSDAEVARWLQVLAEANQVVSAAGRAVSDAYAVAAHRVDGAIDLLADVDGAPAGCGSLVPGDGIGWLGGAATVSRHRGRGVQSVLVDRRLELAAEAGLGLVAATALPHGTSARNLRRRGFTLAYTQMVMSRAAG